MELAAKGITEDDDDVESKPEKEYKQNRDGDSEQQGCVYW